MKAIDGSFQAGMSHHHPLLWMLVKKSQPEWMGGVPKPAEPQRIPQAAVDSVIQEFLKELPEYKYTEVAYTAFRLLEFWMAAEGYEIVAKSVVS